MKCFYHSGDFDGYASAAIIKNKYPDCEMIGINYGQEFLFDKIDKNELIFMVDFCLQPFDLMKKLNKHAVLVWIDHHKSAIEEYKKYDKVIEGKHQIGKAGCELTWDFINKNKKMPTGIFLLGRYDVWDLDKRADIMPFQYGLKSYDTNLDSDIWKKILSDDQEFTNDVLKRGKTIMDYVKEEDKKYVDACSFETELDGMKCIAVNKMLTSSQLFDSVWDNKKYDIMLVFGYKNKQWTVSLYTDKKNLDVSKIAKKYGGGGHAGASGFQVDNIDKILKRK